MQTSHILKGKFFLKLDLVVYSSYNNVYLSSCNHWDLLMQALNWLRAYDLHYNCKYTQPGNLMHSYEIFEGHVIAGGGRVEI